MENNAEEHIQNLKKFHTLCKSEIENLSKKQFVEPSQDREEVQMLKEEMRELIFLIASNGNTSAFEWAQLRDYLAIAIKDALFFMQKKYPDNNSAIGETFEDTLSDLVELFQLFDQE